LYSETKTITYATNCKWQLRMTEKEHPMHGDISFSTLLLMLANDKSKFRILIKFAILYYRITFSGYFCLAELNLHDYQGCKFGVKNDS
jgi:hypothetical protein